MKNPIKKIFFYLIIIAFFSPTTLHTCSDYPMAEDYRYSLFSPNTAGLQQYRPFYFTTIFLNEGVPELIKMGIDTNLQEWANYLENEVEIEEIRKFLYRYQFKQSDVEYVNMDALKNKNIYKYQLVKHLVEKQDKATLDYILYAKEVEKALEIGGAWTDDKLAKPALQKLIDLAKNVYPQANPKLQLRYGYQMVVLARYLEDYPQAVKLYDQYIKPLQSESIVKYWAMMHRATALFHTGQEAAADYNFAISFKNAPNKRHRAYQGFEGNNIEASLKFAKNDQEKAALWLMKGIRSPGKALESINNVYALATDMPELELLITREINKLEDWLLTPAYTGFESASIFINYEEIDDQNKENDRKYLDRILNFVEKGIQSNKVHNLAFWNLSAAYLSFMNDNYLQANTYLQQAETAKGTNEEIQNQIHLTRIMAFTNDYGGISQEAESQLFESLQWLQKNYPPDKQKESEYGYPSPTTYEKVMFALAARYEKNKEVSKAAMFISQVNNLLRAPTKEFINSNYSDYFFYLNEFADTKDLENLLELAVKKDKTPYEQFLTQKVVEDQNRILDLLGTMYLRQDKMEESLAVFNQIPKDYWKSDAFDYETYLDANPFYANFYSGHTATIGDTIRYTKLEFVKEMLNLKTIAAEGGLDEASCNFLIANGYYNMTFYGNSWMMVRYWATSAWEYSLSTSNKQYDDIANFYGCTQAKNYYVKAAEIASSCSFAALCYRMAGKCDYRQELFEKTLAADNPWDREEPQFKDNHYYNLLRSNFAAYYDKLIDDCTSISDFIAWGD
ncbi:MAG: hypothetical protein R3E32_02165 [Chitinophagales bacterium]